MGDERPGVFRVVVRVGGGDEGEKTREEVARYGLVGEVGGAAGSRGVLDEEEGADAVGGDFGGLEGC